MRTTLRLPSKWLRAAPAKGVSDGAKAIDPEGGRAKAGLIRGAAVVTRGEAIGHSLWLDSEFVDSIAGSLNERTRGLKARFTHPSLSGDGLGTYLGRFFNASLDGDVVRADLHFAKSAHETPDGDLARYVMRLGSEDPDVFGTSIVFSDDFDAEEGFLREHRDEDGVFSSPDAENTKNLPHARLADLHAADVVDEPAANPDGLFHHRKPALLDDCEGLLDYGLGISAVRPSMASLSVDADRARGFLARYLRSRGLEIRRAKEVGRDPLWDRIGEEMFGVNGHGRETPRTAP